MAALPGAAERTIAAHSVSKSFAMAGNRVGYLVGPAETIDRIEQLTTYWVYSVNRGGQRAAAHALRTGGSWLESARGRYAEVGRAAARRLGVDPPEGGTFLFLDVAPSLDGRGMLGLLEDCLQQGLLVAPGEVFGRDYATWVRLCFTAVEPERALAGVDVLARLLGR
jgi:N-succinyldiaminopimelate aminotransferase